MIDYQTKMQLMAHLANMPHYDSGGTVLKGPTTAAPAQNVAGYSPNAQGLIEENSNPFTALTMKGVADNLTALFGGGSNQFQAAGTPIQQGTNTGQLNQAYGQSQQGINSQNALMQALQRQNGIQNQSNVYNQLQGVANGTGPNPAMAQLNNATGANVANQAALMAGQRGSGANAGLLARQAALQGGGLQQQAAGQGAALQAQQSLNALGQLGGISGQQVAQQAGATQGYTQAAQQGQQNLLNSLAQSNTANVGMQSNLNTVNADVSEKNQAANKGLIGGLLNGVGSAISSIFAEGGKVTNPKIEAVAPKNRFSSSILEPHIEHMARIYHPEQFNSGNFAKGGKVNALVSPGEVYLPPDKAKAVVNGKADPIKDGKRIPGKAEVKGNSVKNDTVPAKLEEGGIVIPREVLQSKNPSSAAAKFVEAHLKKNGSGNEEDDFKSALKKAISNRKAS